MVRKQRREVHTETHWNNIQFFELFLVKKVWKLLLLTPAFWSWTQTLTLSKSSDSWQNMIEKIDKSDDMPSAVHQKIKRKAENS